MSNSKTKNLGKRPNKESLGIEYRGVSVNAYLKNNNKGTGKVWGHTLRSRIQKSGTRYNLGSYMTAEEAALAYNAKARSLYTTKRAQKLGMWNDVA